MNDFRYILRYKIDPAFGSDQRIEELVDFCVESKIEEVMLLFCAEELSCGHPTFEEIEPYVNTAKQLKTKLDEVGKSLSLNPWSTTYHVSRGRKLKQGQDFKLMVGESGVDNGITACPLCANWQKYLCDIFAYMACEIKPSAIWIEDDWRLHNHGEKLGFGGCYCDYHMKQFSEMVGQTVTREKLLDKILRSAEVHPWRKIWLDLCNTTMIQPLERLCDSIRKACSDTQIGLMCSSPDAHGAEGRDWEAVKNAIGEPFLFRPHLPPYTETTVFDTPPSVTRMTIACIDGDKEIYPELENSPRSGLYSKSGSFSIWECFSAAAYGSKGITINHYDMLGNGISLDASLGKVLSDNKAMLNSLADLGINEANSEGVNILFSPDVSRYIIGGESAKSVSDIVQDSTVWSKTLFNLGISHRFTKNISDPNGTYAVSGQTLSAFSDSDIKKLLSCNVVLDAYSVEILLNRGFGALIGVNSADWINHEDTGYSYETVLDSDEGKYGLAYPRMTAQRCSDKMLVMNIADDVQIRTEIKRFCGKTLCAGLGVFHNSAGGKIAVIAYPFDGQKQFFMGYFNIYRQILMQNLFMEFCGSNDIAMATPHPMHVYRNEISAGTLFSVFNIIPDPAEKVSLRLPVKESNLLNFKLLTKTGQWQEISPNIVSEEQSLLLEFDTELKYLEGCFLLRD